MTDLPPQPREDAIRPDPGFIGERQIVLRRRTKERSKYLDQVKLREADALGNWYESVWPWSEVWTEEKLDKFIALYSNIGNIAETCRQLGVGHGSFLKLYKHHPKLKRLTDEAKRVANGRLEEEARKRAMVGVTEPIYYKGALVGHKKVPSDRLMEKLLEGNIPHKYKDAKDGAGSSGGLIIQINTVDPSTGKEKIIDVTPERPKLNEQDNSSVSMEAEDVPNPDVEVHDDGDPGEETRVAGGDGLAPEGGEGRAVD